MLQILIFFFIVTPSSLFSMKITTPRVEEITTEDLLKKAVGILHKKNPHYKIFNPSNDIRNLSFLSPHLKKYNPLKKKLKKYEKELSTLYLITMQHLNSVGTAQNETKSFLVDIKRFYINCLPNYPENVEQKCTVLTNYFSKSSINSTTLFQEIPSAFHQQLKSLLDSFLKQYPHLKISTIITLDRSEEAGYFALLRFTEKENPAVHETVYELQSMKQFCWDIGCSSIKEYYEKHRLFFIHELHKPQGHRV